jgi:hypothetical protein
VDCWIFKREVRRPQAVADLREDGFPFKVWPWQQSKVKGGRHTLGFCFSVNLPNLIWLNDSGHP